LHGAPVMTLLHKLQLTASIVAIGCAACASTDQAVAPHQPPNPPTQTTGASVAGTTSTSTLTANPTDTGAIGYGVPANATNTSVSSTHVAPAALPNGAGAENVTLSDGQIGMIASDIDTAEIDAAKLALTRAKNAKVRQFAQHMITAHTNAEQKLQSTLKRGNITPADSSVSQRLVNESQSQADTLRANNGADFDHAYIAAQVSGHQEALSLFDDELLPSVKDAQLKTGLEQTRLKVIEHIKMAEDVQASLTP
jgi:putative membrane protein